MRLHARFGFTLIESIIYTLIVTMTITGFILIVQATFNIQTKFKAQTLLHEHLRFSLQKMEARVQAADTVTYPPAGTTSTRLTLAMSETSKHPTIFELQNGVLMFTEGTNPGIALTSEKMYVNAFTVTHTTTTPSSVRILLTVQTLNTQSATGTSATIQETLSIRR